MPVIFGPVRSRRLGTSLGIDIVPFKTCSFDCVYCECGKTTKKTTQREIYASPEAVLRELEVYLKKSPELDYLTFSGAGEPTLNSALGEIIRGIKKMTKIPVAVLTNASLINIREVREDLKEADLVIPSLNAADEKLFKYINRPCEGLSAKKIVGGLSKFRKEFKGKIWLGIMILGNVDYTEKDMKLLKSAVDKIKPDRIQLNCIARPPAEDFCVKPDGEKLLALKKFLGPNVEILSGGFDTETKRFAGT